MSRPKSLYRYEVTAVRGAVPRGIEVGAVIRDTWHRQSYTWLLVDLPTGATVAEWDGKLLGRAAESLS